MNSVLGVLLKYKFIILFYIAIILFFYLHKKRVQVQAKIIYLYRMKWGLKWMDKYAKKHRAWIILLGYVGMGTGFVGLVFMTYILIKNLVTLIIQPTAQNGVSLVLPGINVPGLGVLPFWYWIIAIFIIAVVHEFAHGVVARAHKVEVKNTGIVLFGPILGAFVEPNEKKLRKQSDVVQYSILAAGSFSNILLALVAVVLLLFVFTPIQQSMVEPAGFSFGSYYGENYPAQAVGVPVNTPITTVNGVKVLDFQGLSKEVQCTQPGDTVMLGTANDQYNLTLGANPEDKSKAFLGINAITNEFVVKEKYSTGVWKAVYNVVDWLTGFFRWLFLLSFGIGLFNLLPLPIVDGGRMAQVFLHKWKGKVKGDKRYHQISLFLLLVLLLNLLWPLLIKLF